MKYFLETYGCQMNVAESLALENELHKRRWSQANTPEEADLVVLNTCAVRQTAENRVWGRIGYYKSLKQKKKLALVVMGCMTERLKESIKDKESAVDILVGTQGKDDFIHFLDDFELGQVGKDFLGYEDYQFQDMYADPNDAQAFVPIMHGCNNFCSYCIVPYVRGREKSRDVSAILAELKVLEKGNTKEVTLIGQNVNSYKYSFNGVDLDFADLLELLLKETTIEWFRFMSSHPKDLSDKLIKVISESDRVCNHIHLPVQHGSNRILKKMNRKYTVEHYLDLMNKIKKAVPNISLSTDILVGFPGETEDDFQELLNFVKQVQYSDAFTYYYNPREGTASFKMDNEVEKSVKLERLNRLIELQRDISQNVKKKRIGTTVKALAENISKNNKKQILARTELNDMVIIDGDENMLGNFFNIRLNSISGVTFKGEIV